MNEHRRPATKPERLRTNVPSQITSPISPALQGATSAFLPRQSPATTTLSPLSASASSTGARFAARAAGITSQIHSSSSPTTASLPRDATSPERGRSTDPLCQDETTGSSHEGLSRLRLSPARPLRIERSPSTIAAIHASSKSSSPARSPSKSPHRRANTLSTGPTSQILPSELSKALAGAVKSMVSSPKEPEQPFVPVRNRLLNFEKLPSMVKLSSPDETQNSLQRNPTKKLPPRPSTLIPQASLEVPTPTRDRAHSVGDERALRKILSKSSLSQSNVPSKGPSPPSANVHRVDRMQRPAIPVRQTHNIPRTNSIKDSQDHRGMTVNSLADAMVASSLASSLASSRAVSPAKKRPLPLTSRRRSRSFSALYDLSAKYDVEPPRKPPRPPRPMKQTLRKPSETEDDEIELVKRGRRHWMRKHPNKHHEGDRKRWRDKVTERERKRYEGIFAANRGLLIGNGYFRPSAVALADNSFESNKVVNIIVRDIWERSRLPSDILMEIYDLVTPEQDKSLGREQFVVGMWLIDQRLKGRKLPVKVSSSVWTSVRHPDGIKLRGRGA